VTPDALRAALAGLGLTQTAFARLLGVHRLTVHAWCSGKLPVPHYAEVIVSLLTQLSEPRSSWEGSNNYEG
jgi:Predicted transcriptional regulators